ncbi:hypothetical protein [Vibrio owensii]|uniref:hypothetical protein n=1 Tax=Vibrio harveyi group TaxID=717610 RepID=UPI003CC5762B
MNHLLQITVKGKPTNFVANKTASEIAVMLKGAEEHFDFSFFIKNGISSKELRDHEKDYEFFIPKSVVDKIEERLPDFSDFAGFEYVKNENGNQPVTQYDCANAIMAFAKAFNNELKFEKAPLRVESLNDYVKHPIGDFLYD